MHNTFFSWNLMVDLTSVTFELKSSECEMGAGNLPADLLRVGQPVLLYYYDRRVVEYLSKARVLEGEESA